MSFIIFFIYFFFSLLICILIGLFIYKLFIRRKCGILSKIASNEIDNYFNAYDTDFNNCSQKTDILDQNDIKEDDTNDTNYLFF